MPSLNQAKDFCAFGVGWGGGGGWMGLLKDSHMELVTVLGDKAVKAKTNAVMRSTHQPIQKYKATPEILDNNADSVGWEGKNMEYI